MVLIYDIETFPNYFSALFITEDGEVEYIFEKREGVDQLAPLAQFVTKVENLTLVGYNSLDYDDIMLKAIIEKPDMTNRQLFAVSNAIIKTEKKRDLPGTLKDIAYAAPPWNTVDLLKLLEVNMNRPSLKHCSIHLKHDWLQDLPLAFDSLIKDSDVPLIIRYNRNDVRITRNLFILPNMQDVINLRLSLGREYDVDLRSAGDSKISNVIFEKRYGKPEVTQTRRSIIYGSELIPPTLKFETDEMQQVIRQLESITFVETEDYTHTVTDNSGNVIDVVNWRSNDVTLDTLREESEQAKKQHAKKTWLNLLFNGVSFGIGKGGLHSDDPARIVEPKQDMLLRDADVGSYYPSMILRYELVPEHLDRVRFLEVYRRIVEERLEGKAKGDKVKADGLKIAINGAFGKLNFPYFWLYDPLAFYRVTLYGQLLLLDLIEKLYLAGIDCISANTDGIVCHFPKDKEEIYYEVCKEWQTRTGMALEYTDYAKFVQLNVNSYMSITTSGKIKTKKDFEDNLELTKQTFVKGFSAPVIALALQNYFTDGVLPEEFIRGHEDIHDFFYTQRAGQKFAVFFVNGRKEEKLQKTNRYYVSTSGGYLVKRDITPISNKGAIKGTFKSTRETGILKGKYVTIMNNVPERLDKNINFDYYIGQVRDLIEKIEGKKSTMPKSIFEF